MNPAVAASEVANVVRHTWALVFDFNGMLVNSNPIKWHAFELFRSLPLHRDFTELLAG